MKDLALKTLSKRDYSITIKISKTITFFLALQLLFLTANSQEKTLTSAFLKQKFENYTTDKREDHLFLHVDKTLYTNNEQIWFTGYLINASNTQNNHNFLCVYLCREGDKEIQLQHRFVMENGISFGNLTLPDSIAPGNYNLMAYTNVIDKNNKPIALFKQPITIKSITEEPFKVTASLDKPEEKNFIKIKVDVAIDPKEKKKPEVYFIDKNFKKELIKADSIGKFFVTVPTTELAVYKANFLVTVKYKNQIKHLQVDLPKPKEEQISVKFYPEGGYLINGIVNVVGWEVKGTEGNQINTKAILYRGNDIVDTIKTEGYGIGKFKIIPNSEYEYSIKLIDSGRIQSNSYFLPKTTSTGIALNIKNAVVNDTLSVNIMSNKNQRIQVLVHNYSEIFASLPLKVSPGKLNFNIDLKAMPKGIGTITIIDSLDRPIIERLFFAHYNKKNNVTVTTNQNSYKIKDSTNVKVKFDDFKNEKLTKGLVSIAIVQNNRVESDKQRQIESYLLIGNELKNISNTESNISYQNHSYLENILLVKGWRKFTWLGLISSNTPAASDTLRSIAFTGNLLYFEKPLKVPKFLTLVSDSSYKLINTDKLGNFTLSYDELLVSQDKKIWLMVNEKNKDGYKINFNNPSIQISQYFEPELFVNYVNKYSTNANFQNKKTINLNDVTINGSYNNLLYKAPIPNVKTNLCGDYFCAGRHLNCQIVSHLGHTSVPKEGDFYIPLSGKTYTTAPISAGNSRIYQVAITVDRIKYAGCYLERLPVNELSKINGIEISRDFYQDKEAEKHDENNYLSTIYWNHGILLNENGEVNFSFINGSIPDKFKIIIQGVDGNNNPLFAEKEFNVNKN
ncbi:hypothetical protein [Pedobacter nototheniae]|uniref:hypothetical protein n=1 Tax=Pedobacter nototheniae TaxID=2488994 RepID=UPI00103934DB|nr:hypothetical protein [Pedobacter nototheniae]